MSQSAISASFFQRYKCLALQGIGLLCVALGIVGVALPVMPSTVFFIMALACFTHSSPRLESWLLNHPKVGPSLLAWREHKVVPTRAKWFAAIGMSIGLYMMMLSSAPSFAIILVAAIEACVLTYLIRRPSCAVRLYACSPHITATLVMAFVIPNLLVLYITRY
ncbi:YbaN family protein [Pseudoalteromonas pernae]|uniref:YbaN family protein n=1 Tax=Pseudoalteromonas pernae TaxID=3118054 RepID=UPI003242AEF6